MNMRFKSTRGLAARAAMSHNKKAAETPARRLAKKAGAMSRGLRFHLRRRESFREMLARLANTPFRISLPGFKAGGA
jgi:hypothetical protein